MEGIRKQHITNADKRKFKKEIKEGKTYDLFDDKISKGESKKIFGNDVKTKLLNWYYYLFEKLPNGEIKFSDKAKAKKLKINKNPKSFKKPNLLEKTNNGLYDYKNIYNSLNINGNTNILGRGNKKEDNLDNLAHIETLSSNALYDINIIYLDIYLRISAEEKEAELKLFNTTINNYKQRLNIPINSLLTPLQINSIVVEFMYNDIDGWLVPFRGYYSDLTIETRIGIRNKETQLTLKTDGEKYFLLNDIRNYTDMTHIFDKKTIFINIEENKNCVIETLNYIYNNLLPNGNKKIFKKELENMDQRYIKDNEIPSYNKLVEFLETTKTNYNIFNWTDINDGNKNIFDKKKRTYNFIVYNKHLYLIDNETEYKKIKDIYDTNGNYIILSETQFNKKINSLLKKNIHPEIIKADKEKNTSRCEILAFKLKNEDRNEIYIKDNDEKIQKNLLYLCQHFEIPYTPFITLGNIINKILKHHNIRENKSFYLYNHSAKDPIYSEEIIEDEENNITIDFNKYYTNLLLSLEEIPIINNLIHKTEIYKESEEINNNYVYSIEILNNKYNLCFRNDDLYFGVILNTPYYKPMLEKMIKENNIKIHNKIKCDWVPNYYKPIIEELFKIVDKTNNKNNMILMVKKTINFLIGKFHLNAPEMNNYLKNFHIENVNEVINYHHNENENENYFNYNNDDTNYKIFYEQESKINNYYNVLENHRPLRQLIFNLSWLNINKFVIDNKIDDWDILQIKIDSMTIRNKKLDPRTITDKDIEELEELGDKQAIKKLKKLKYKKEDEMYYNGKYNYLIELIKKEQENDKYNLSGVKFEVFKKASNSLIPSNNISFIDDIIKHHNKFIVNLGYAGSGKSYKINNLIQECIKNNQTYILLAPLLKVLKLYPKNINKNTVQHYFTNNKIPIEDNIFIDEALIINDNDFKYIINWLYTHNKNIYIFGDEKQLPPIPKKYYKKLNEEETEEENEDTEKTTLNIEFLKSISTEFNYFLDTDKNFRNNFNFDVYDSFIKNEFTKQEQIILINHFINDKADETKPNFINICYRNDTRDNINNEYLNKNKQIYDKKNKKIIGVNIPLISKKNYKINENIIICAKDEYNLSVIDDKYILSFEDINNNLIKFEMDKDKIFSLFNVRYCLNLYNIQGQTLTNFKFILDDVYFLNKENKYNISGAFYTLISRIKEPLTEKKITIEDINNILISGKKNINNNYSTNLNNKEYRNIKINYIQKKK